MLVVHWQKGRESADGNKKPRRFFFFSRNARPDRNQKI